MGAIARINRSDSIFEDSSYVVVGGANREIAPWGPSLELSSN